MDDVRGCPPGLDLRTHGQVPIVNDTVVYREGEQPVSVCEEPDGTHQPAGVGELPPQGPARNVPNLNDSLRGTQGEMASVAGEAPPEPASVRYPASLEQRLLNIVGRPLPAGDAAAVIESHD